MNLVQDLENNIILPAHTFHALHPLDVSCFVSLKITFKKDKDTTMARNKYLELNKITLVGWVD
jgi:hypothetical protein